MDKIYVYRLIETQVDNPSRKFDMLVFWGELIARHPWITVLTKNPEDLHYIKTVIDLREIEIRSVY